MSLDIFDSLLGASSNANIEIAAEVTGADQQWLNLKSPHDATVTLESRRFWIGIIEDQDPVSSYQFLIISYRSATDFLAIIIMNRVSSHAEEQAGRFAMEKLMMQP